MSKAGFQLVYEGPGLREHTMDVQELAPALLAVGNLCNVANRMFNEEKTHAQVLIRSEFKPGSFLVDFQLVLGLYERMMGLLIDPKIVSAKELLDWLNILSGIGVAGGHGLFWYLKIRNGRKIASVDDKGNTVSVTFEGDNNSVLINQHVYRLGENKEALDACKKIVKPMQTPDIDCVKFKDKGKVYETINKSEASAIMKTEVESKEEETVKPQIIGARLTVHTVIFDTAHSRWRFKYGEEIIPVDVSETQIREDTLKRGGVNVGDAYKVKLEITERKTETGKYVNDYKIKDVLEFTPGHYPHQGDLFSGGEATSS